MLENESIYRQAELRIENRKENRSENIKQISSLIGGQPFDWTRVEAPARLAERARRLGLQEEANALLLDPTNMELGNQVFEKIIHANNLLPVSFLEEGATKARGVGRITLPVTGGTKLGTGFMVSSRVMMTNNHVLSERAEAENGTLEFDFYKRENGTTGPVARFRLEPQLLFVTDQRLDFTIVAVEEFNADGRQVADRGWFPLAGPSGKAVVGERVSIIQHPNGEPQQVSVHDNKIVDVNFSDDFLHYETDTMGGSSGSPVLSINWDLVALHHAAVGSSNEGIRISSIVRKLHEIFGRETSLSGPGRDSRIIAELLEARNPPAPSLSEPTRPAAQDGPRMNSDGTASWTVPVTLTIGIGQAPATELPSPPESPQPPAKKSPEDPELSKALQKLEATEGLVYYDSEKDQQVRDEYYPNLDGLSKTQLYKTLSKLLADTHTTTLSYKKARLEHLYPWIDRRDGCSRDLQGVYSGKVFDALDVIRHELQMERRREQAIHERMRLEAAGTVDETFLEELEAAHPYNCEHVVPQSWFHKRKQPRTDLHHLFTCEWGCNSFRGNRAYFDFVTEAFRDNCGESDHGKFEPQAGKGAVARATLYFLLRYPGDIADTVKEMPRERLKMLIKWAKDFEVNSWELHRNAEIHKIQGNRNPLIDHPALVSKINFELGLV